MAPWPLGPEYVDQVVGQQQHVWPSSDNPILNFLHSRNGAVFAQLDASGVPVPAPTGSLRSSPGAGSVTRLTSAGHATAPLGPDQAGFAGDMGATSPGDEMSFPGDEECEEEWEDEEVVQDPDGICEIIQRPTCPRFQPATPYWQVGGAPAATSTAVYRCVYCMCC